MTTAKKRAGKPTRAEAERMVQWLQTEARDGIAGPGIMRLSQAFRFARVADEIRDLLIDDKDPPPWRLDKRAVKRKSKKR